MLIETLDTARDLGRLKEILGVMVRHGFGDTVRRLGLTDRLERAGQALNWTHAADLARAQGFSFGNADVTLICEAPKIGPHAAAMQIRLAEIMGIEAARVSVKATTSERLGFTGRGEGIAAQAVALLARVDG